MQEMSDPQRRAYNEGYLADEEDGGQGRWVRQQDESQQKLQPKREATLSTTNYVLATVSMVVSPLIMALSIALLALTATIFGRTVGSGVIGMLPYGVAGMIIARFVISLILLLFSIAGFVLSVIQLSIMGHKRKRARGYGRGRYR